ncbi:hypothetical protein HN51_003881 [Arachis hypogaea]
MDIVNLAWAALMVVFTFSLSLVSYTSVVLLGEAVECCTLDGESPVAESITSLRSDPSSMGHVESRVNQHPLKKKEDYAFAK